MTRTVVSLLGCVTLVACSDIVDPVSLDRVGGRPAFATEGIHAMDLGSFGSEWDWAGAIRVNDAGQILVNTGSRAFIWQGGVVTDIGSLGAAPTYATGLSQAGHVVGFSFPSVPSDTGPVAGPNHAIVWHNGSMADLDPDGIASGANAVNAIGQVVGYRATPTETRAMLWHNGAAIDLGSLGGLHSGAFAINDAGQIVGRSDLPLVLRGDSLVPSGSHAFLWQNGVMTDLGTLGGDYSEASLINASGQIAGASDVGNGFQHAFIWDNGVMIDLGTLGGGWSWASGLNDAGQVVGVAETATGEAHAFLWEAGRMIDLGTLGGPNSWAQGINNLGQIVGAADVADLTPHAFLWHAGVMLDLGTVGGSASEALGLNNNGQVVGYNVFDQSGGHAVLWTLADKFKLEKPKTDKKYKDKK